MISFRLTVEEHERFRQVCTTQGFRSVSELVRTAINNYVEHPARLPHNAAESRIAELENRVNFLALEIHRVSHQDAVVRPAVRGQSAS
jgi:ribbon-helix-helix CopG family protein